jgi:AraC-like DNA-binding protein
MLDAQRTPVRRSSVVTRDPEAAENVINSVFTHSRAIIDKPDENFEFRLNDCEAGALTCRTQRWGFDGHIESQPLTSFIAIVVCTGGLALSRPGRPEARIPSGSVWLYDTGIPTQSRWDRDSAFATVHLALNQGTRFVGNRPVDPAAARYWVSLTRTLYREMTSPDSALENPLIRAHLVRTVTDAALTVFPTTTTTAAYQPGPGHTGPASVRRAVEHMHAHAALPLTLAQIAQAAGTSPRALQAAFLRAHDCTPMAYLRRLRLEHAHRDLEAACPSRGDTVTTIAQRWGFSNPGRFATAYHLRFRVHPSTTLRG